MAYITQQDLIDELGEHKLAQLSDDSDNDPPQVDETKVNAVIENARGQFESYIRTRYSLPVPTTPLVKKLNKQLAIYELYENRATLAEDGLYKIRQNAYNAAIAMLKDISLGRAALDVPAADETKDNPATSDRVLTNNANTKFSDDKLKSF